MEILFILISSFFILLWAIFFLFFSPRKTTPAKLISLAFICGSLAVVLAWFVEGLILSLTISSVGFNFVGLFRVSGITFSLSNNPVLYYFIGASFIEEFIKFLLLKQIIKRVAVDQVIDGIKAGFWIGMGFAFLENILYFSAFYSQYSSVTSSPLFSLILIRGLLSTLAHGLYGIVMGYYLALAKFHALYCKYFLRIAFGASFIAHGLFNLFLFMNVAPVSVLLLAFLLASTLLWYGDRKNIEYRLQSKIVETAKLPFLARKYEMETLFTRQNSSPELYRRLFYWFPPKS